MGLSKSLRESLAMPCKGLFSNEVRNEVEQELEREFEMELEREFEIELGREFEGEFEIELLIEL